MKNIKEMRRTIAMVAIFALLVMIFYPILGGRTYYG